MHCKVFGFWIFRAGKRSRSAAAHGTNKQPPRRPLIVAGRSVDQTCTHKYHHWGYAIDAVAVFKIEHRPLLYIPPRCVAESTLHQNVRAYLAPNEVGHIIKGMRQDNRKN